MERSLRRRSNYGVDSSGVIESAARCWWLVLGFQQREIPAGDAHRHGVVPFASKRSVDPGRGVGVYYALLYLSYSVGRLSYNPVFA